LGEPTAGVEDFDADDAAVFPVECDEPVDTVGCGGLRGGAVHGTGIVAEVDVDGVRVGVVGDAHVAIVARRSATSCQYTTSDSRRFKQRIASFGVLPSSRLGRPEARCQSFGWSVSSGRPPNPACPLLSTGLSTSPGWAVGGPQAAAVHGVGIFVPR
jgi:hypothetical protein